MQQAYINLNPLVRSVVHESFHRAIKSTGMPEFSQEVFFEEIVPYLRAPDSIFAESEKLRLWKSILHGDIIATEMWDNMQVFYVRGVVGTRVIDIRLALENHKWHIHSIISMYVRPYMRSPLFHRMTFIGAVVIAAAIGYTLHHPTPALVTRVVSQSIATPSVVSKSVATPSVITSGKTQAKKTTTLTNSKPGITARPQLQALAFTLTPGMSVQGLTRFLQAHRLIKDELQFDIMLKRTKIDRTIRPGTYHFRTGMTANQITQVLQHGPSK